MHSASYRLLVLEIRTDEAAKLPFYTGGTNIRDEVRSQRVAEDAYRGLVAEWTQMKGEDFLETLRCRYMLAETLSFQKKYPEAKVQYQTALNGIDRTQGWKGLLALEWRERFASMLETMGKYDEAEVLWRKVVQAGMETKEPPQRVWNSLCSNLEHQEKYREEVTELRAQAEMIRPLAETQRRELGNRRLGRGQTDYRYEEEVLQAEIDLVERRAAAKQALDDAKTKWGEDHEETRACHDRLEALKKEKPTLPKRRAGSTAH